MREWIGTLKVKPLFIESGSPWENGYIARLNGKMRDELLNRGIFYTLTEAQVLIEEWRRTYNTIRPHAPAISITQWLNACVALTPEL